MAIKGVDPKCYILALFVREDGERFLLGSGRYVFKEKQQHFQANKMANDVIEVQGNDGYLLAGQVRRPGTQDFDGYVGDGTSSKEQVEQWRRDFFKFFRKNYLYKVIYVFSDGSAIQRKRGFLVDAPTVEELYQIYPEYHVALNFEDINYYFYNEDSDGNEIYGKSAIIGLSVGATGGLMWDNLGAISLPYSWLNPVSVSGTDIQINNQLSDEVPITDLQLAGDTFQQTYSGKNLFKTISGGNLGITGTANSDGTITVTGTSQDTYANITTQFVTSIPAGTYTFSITKPLTHTITLRCDGNRQIIAGNTSVTFTTTNTATGLSAFIGTTGVGVEFNETFGMMLEAGSSKTSWEKFVGGTASPNPDYPQDINVVTGEQTVKVTGKNLAYTGWAQDFVTRINDSAAAKLETVDGKSCIFWKSNAGYGDYDNKYMLKIPFKENTQYTLSFDIKPTSAHSNIGFKYTDGTVSGELNNLTANTWQSISITSTANKTIKYIQVNFFNGNCDADLDTFMLEEGTATPYESYQSQAYTIDLGSIELAKIGDYQDYIYKDGDDWYVHKEVENITLDGTQSIAIPNWRASDTSVGWVYAYNVFNSATIAANSVGAIVSDKLLAASFTSLFDKSLDIGIALYINTDYGLAVRVKDPTLTTISAVNTYLGSNPIDVYYPLATPTDTKITDATLIEELDGLEGTKLFIGENNVLVTANGSNLPATLSFKYYTGINYDGAGFEWEPGGSGGDDMITVDSIDDVYPMLTIPGPVVNPTITNVTTGSVFQYTGTLSSTQKLEVDLMAKTAFLNGVSVIANVTSSSLYFKSGVNRVNYTTNNADAPNATIKWQEIVG